MPVFCVARTERVLGVLLRAGFEIALLELIGHHCRLETISFRNQVPHKCCHLFHVGVLCFHLFWLHFQEVHISDIVGHCFLFVQSNTSVGSIDSTYKPCVSQRKKEHSPAKTKTENFFKVLVLTKHQLQRIELNMVKAQNPAAMGPVARYRKQPKSGSLGPCGQLHMWFKFSLLGGGLAM